MTYNTLKVDKKNGILMIKINRPQVLNALDSEAFDELEKCFDFAKNDLNTKVVVLTGEGKVFSSGGDMSLLKLISESTPNEIRSIVYRVQRQMGKMVEIEKPVIVAINGAAIGVGLGVALLGDIRIAAENAVLATEFVKVGIIPETGVTYTLARIIGYSKALELVLTARRISGKEAAEIGLVNKAVPLEELEKTTMKLASELSSLPAISLGLTKRAMRMGLMGTLEAAFENEATFNSICYATEDHKEAVKAFKEKRAPKFMGK